MKQGMRQIFLDLACHVMLSLYLHIIIYMISCLSRFARWLSIKEILAALYSVAESSEYNLENRERGGSGQGSFDSKDKSCDPRCGRISSRGSSGMGRLEHGPGSRFI